MVHAITGLFLGLFANTRLGRGAIEQTCRHFDQQAVVAVDEHRQAELPRQHHAALFPVEQQDRRAIATVVDLTRLALPLAIVALVIEGDLLQQIPVVGQHLRFDDVDPFGCVGHDRASLWRQKRIHPRRRIHFRKAAPCIPSGIARPASPSVCHRATCPPSGRTSALLPPGGDGPCH
ncbi:hypothetical protein D3C73_636980 [compost metagenome]